MAVHEARRPDRRLHPRQADRPRPRRRRVPRPPLPEPLRQPEAGPDPLRRPGRRTPAGSPTTARSAASTRSSFYVTTTSSGADAVESWFAWWLADWDLDVHAHRRHPGPRGVQPRRPAGARDPGRADRPRLLQRGASPTSTASAARSPASPACCCGSASSASSATRSTARPLRPAALWDALLEAGAADGIRPFGLEPQRVLRLQKMHILVGQDTDSESTRFEARDAVDRQARQGAGLHRPLGARAVRGARRRRSELVGFTCANGDVPTRGRRGARRGRRSARAGDQRRALAAARGARSGWPGCRATLAEDGASITISDRGQADRGDRAPRGRSTTPTASGCVG